MARWASRPLGRLLIAEPRHAPTAKWKEDTDLLVTTPISRATPFRDARWAGGRRSPPAQRTCNHLICAWMAAAAAVIVAAGSAPPIMAASALPHGSKVSAMAVMLGI